MKLEQTDDSPWVREQETLKNERMFGERSVYSKTTVSRGFSDGSSLTLHTDEMDAESDRAVHVLFSGSGKDGFCASLVFRPVGLVHMFGPHLDENGNRAPYTTQTEPAFSWRERQESGGFVDREIPAVEETSELTRYKRHQFATVPIKEGEMSIKASEMDDYAKTFIEWFNEAKESDNASDFPMFVPSVL